MEEKEREESEAHQDSPLQPHLVLSLGPHPLSGIFSKVLERDATEGGRGTATAGLRPRLHLISRSARLQTAWSTERVNQERLPAVVLWSKP